MAPDAKALAARIRENGTALEEARAGRNGHLLAALGLAELDAEGRILTRDAAVDDEQLNAALLLIPDSIYARFLRDDFVNPEHVKAHHAKKAAEQVAIEEDRVRSAGTKPVLDAAELARAQAAASRRGGDR